MKLDPTWVLVSMAISGVGFVLFGYGRKQRRWPQGIAGVAMMVYPYFVPSVVVMAIIGAALGALTWLAVRLGW
ncbi:MAG TPA: amino acid transport protein [Polyangia bacterium]|jgi:hypothetical protein